MAVVGKKSWVIPDCELPPEGEGVLKGHESVVIVNDSNKKAVIKVALYFVEDEAYENITWEVEPKRRKMGWIKQRHTTAKRTQKAMEDQKP